MCRKSRRRVAKQADGDALNRYLRRICVYEDIIPDVVGRLEDLGIPQGTFEL